jgi:hypothetical protein
MTMRNKSLAVALASLLLVSGCSFMGTYTPSGPKPCSTNEVTFDTVVFVLASVALTVSAIVAANNQGDPYNVVPFFVGAAAVPLVLGNGIGTVYGWTKVSECRSKMPRPAAP